MGGGSLLNFTTWSVGVESFESGIAAFWTEVGGPIDVGIDQDPVLV
jgi:hypothetical protein